jgi:hypothetical protein
VRHRQFRSKCAKEIYALYSRLFVGDEKKLNRGLELLNRFTKCETRPISVEERLTLVTAALVAPLLVLHWVVCGMTGTSTLYAIYNPKCHHEHVAPPDRYRIISYIVIICLLLCIEKLVAERAAMLG